MFINWYSLGHMVLVMFCFLHLKYPLRFGSKPVKYMLERALC